MCVHTVVRCTPNRREIETTLSPFARAVLIASTWLSVSGVLARLLGFATTSGSPSTASRGSSPRPSFACSYAVPSRSNLCRVFGLSPPASTVVFIEISGISGNLPGHNGSHFIGAPTGVNAKLRPMHFGPKVFRGAVRQVKTDQGLIRNSRIISAFLEVGNSVDIEPDRHGLFQSARVRVGSSTAEIVFFSRRSHFLSYWQASDPVALSPRGVTGLFAGNPTVTESNDPHGEITRTIPRG